MKTAWILLYLSAITTAGGAILLKLSDGASKIGFVILSLLTYGISFIFFSLAIKELPLSAAHAVSVGVCMVLVAIVGVYFFKEQLSFMKAMFIIVIIIGAIGVNLCD